MKTLRLLGLLLCLWLAGCSKSEVGPGAVDTDEGITAHYTILLSDGTNFVPTQLTANALTIEGTASGTMPQEPFALPDITYRHNSALCFYRALGDCSGEVRSLNLESGNAHVRKIFGDSPSCAREVLALAGSDNTAFIGYNMPGGGIKETVFMVRAVSLADLQAGFTETELEFAPRQMLWSNNRLYVLAYDNAGDTYRLYVLDGELAPQQQELDLGSGVAQIFLTHSGQLLVSYEQRHLLLDPVTLEVLSRVVYAEGKTPNIAWSPASYFDPSDRLYYSMPTAQSETEYAHIPAIYDLGEHIAYLYYFENFLNEAQRNTYYAIADTRAVAYDHHNGLLLIGYQKTGGSKGGLIRVKPVPDPKLIDQIALDGVPMQIHVE